MLSLRQLAMSCATGLVSGALAIPIQYTGDARSNTEATKLTSAIDKKVRADYVGDEVCGSCHEDKIESYRKTAHHLTSQVANKETILGDFLKRSNTVSALKSNLRFEMEQKGDKFYQTAIWGTRGKTPSGLDGDPPWSSEIDCRSRTEKLDLIIGSGGKGQNYVYWKDEQLYQLPVAYSGVYKQWIMSPGYRIGVADFERPIYPRCLECHSTYFEAVYPGPEFNFYVKTNYVLGISCETCHGPGSLHVERYNSKTSANQGSTIVNPAKLPRDRQNDVCALCHAGAGVELQPAFSYVPGEALDKYIDLGANDPDAAVDVHGKQGRLLIKSQCYQMSADLNCSTCHDVHKPRTNLAKMSQHCLRCHQTENSVTHAKVEKEIANNCIDCHMPLLESNVVQIEINGKEVKPRFRSHWIKVYSEAERK
jgi:hypothetical protein